MKPISCEDEQVLELERNRIDLIDRKMAQLLKERSECISILSTVKHRNRLPVFDADREKTIIERVIKENITNYHETDMANIFTAILRAGLNQQLLLRAESKDLTWS